MNAETVADFCARHDGRLPPDIEESISRQSEDDFQRLLKKTTPGRDHDHR